MINKKINFTNPEGIKLSAKLEFPADKDPENFVIFAHCFTCSKNLKAIRSIAGSLTSQGFGVLSFDFTGLGQSEGDFSDTNFSSNVEDITAAAGFLRENYKPPSILIGHSLGGAAVLFASMKIDEVQAVATIGAPSNPEHVQKLVEPEADKIKTEGEAKVNIGGRPFTIKKQFLDDLRQNKLTDKLPNLKKAILIAHSPQDNIVDISNAAELYNAARHPKSFISLDGADHLLSKKEDAQYIGHVIASWAGRYISFSPEKETLSESQSTARIGDASTKFTTQLHAGRHRMVADEPEDAGGMDLGPSPYQLLSSALGACTAMTLRMYADHKSWDLKEVVVHVDHEKRHSEDCENSEKKTSKIDYFIRSIEIEGDLTRDQTNRLLEIADKCPVHRTLKGDIEINTSLK